MPFLITLTVIGVVTGWLSSTLTEGRGLGLLWSLISAIGGSFVGGFLFAAVGERLVGEGPLFFGSLVAATVGAILLVVIVNFARR